ncbi:UvrD-helicase domain-containing protein [Psychroserpens sp. XS_ASV72]|uniref:UvrD-helicase domain-containing protein n=1 Tax=Psychroserpens sp. XS_ASV72 TaxID=3241293 RepID=UPI003514A8CC
MQNQSSFTIYNASAGSGKTYTLVQDYLKIILKSKNLLAFRNILALTFTNKAVGEMKSRIIETLKAFADPSVLNTSNAMFDSLVQDIGVSPEALHKKSKLLLHMMVHNYAAFDISTIDKFNHKLIRIFAHDLNISVSFEVEIDTKSILAKAVDKLIDQAGADDELTKVLVDFAIEKTNEDKSWDISYDFYNISDLLVSENDLYYINELKGKSLKDFSKLKSNLIEQNKQSEAQITSLANEVLKLIVTNGLTFEDFSRKTLPNHFKKASDLDFNRLYDNKLEENIANRTSIYNKSLEPEKAIIIEGLLPQIEIYFQEIKRLVYYSKFLKNAINNITPLSVLGVIKNSLEELKQEEDLLLISEFNSIINDEIINQPAPFIYERIGGKFKHYFIDEFQDTSILQWENLIPLIDNAISGENLRGETGSAMLVGDAKQAIYRWRGGYAEQFINLYSKTRHPFSVDQTVKNLPNNFRSHQTIVEFNNAFFDHISDFAFSNEQHHHIYKKAKQTATSKKEGFVELSFLTVDKDTKDQLHFEAVLSNIEKAMSNGFSLKDICIIVRRKKEGIAIAEFLKEHDIPIISSETLMLKNAAEINFIIHILTLVLQPNNDEVKIKILSYLNTSFLNSSDAHHFYDSLIVLSGYKMLNALKDFGFDFDIDAFLQLPIYEGVESIIRGFHLNHASNAYLQFFLDEVQDYSQKSQASISSFLEYWERRKDSLSIVSPSGENAVQIMTIHKSKGLEFPVVIFPYANQYIYFDISPKVWFPVDPENFNGFSNLYLNLNKDMESYNETGYELYNDYQAMLELDSINLLYVVLTRAIEQLYIVSEYDTDSNNNEKLKFYSGLFINYLKSAGKWNEGETTYAFGNPQRTSEKNSVLHQTKVQKKFISTAKENLNLNILTNSGYIWDTHQEKAIEKGNLIHDIMSYIKTLEDVDYVFQEFEANGKISSAQSKHLKETALNIVNHKLLSPYFTSDYHIYNERDIITENGNILRPDRLAINAQSEVTIIDYKTGLLNASHKEQLFSYQDVLEDMGFTVSKKILVYINEDLTIKEI